LDKSLFWAHPSEHMKFIITKVDTTTVPMVEIKRAAPVNDNEKATMAALDKEQTG